MRRCKFQLKEQWEEKSKNFAVFQPSLLKNYTKNLCGVVKKRGIRTKTRETQQKSILAWFSEHAGSCLTGIQMQRQTRQGRWLDEMLEGCTRPRITNCVVLSIRRTASFSFGSWTKIKGKISVRLETHRRQRGEGQRSSWGGAGSRPPRGTKQTARQCTPAPTSNLGRNQSEEAEERLDQSNVRMATKKNPRKNILP